MTKTRKCWFKGKTWIFGFFPTNKKTKCIDSRAYTLRINSWAICSFHRQPRDVAVDQREEKGTQFCRSFWQNALQLHTSECGMHPRTPNKSYPQITKAQGAAIDFLNIPETAWKEASQRVQEMQRSSRKAETMKSQVLFLFPQSLLCRVISQQIQYEIPEELAKGSRMGNLAKDLRLNVQEFPARKLWVSAEDFFNTSAESGDLLVSNKIDKEKICGGNLSVHWNLK